MSGQTGSRVGRDLAVLAAIVVAVLAMILAAHQTKPADNRPKPGPTAPVRPTPTTR